MSGTARIIDLAMTLALAGLERAAVVEKVREMEADGATAEQITNELQAMRKASEDAAQAKIDQARERG